MRDFLGCVVLCVPLSMVACGGDGAGTSAQGVKNADSGAVPAASACDIHSGFPGDDACLPAPAPGTGIQIHIGPSDYTDTAEVAKFTMQPGDESSECWSFHTPNDADVYYQSFELRGRPGTHHIINTMFKSEVTEGAFTVCRDPGVGVSPDLVANLPGASKAYMPRFPVAPENAHLGQLVPAHTPAQADMHYFNLTEAPLLREFWLNLYTVPKDQVTVEPLQIRGMGGLSWTLNPIPPGTHQTYSYTCPIDTDGRIVSLLGHTHSHGIRETAWVRHASGDRQKVFEQFDYKNPQIFYYDTVAKNPDFQPNLPGATTGVLEVKAGDALDWECEVNNDGTTPLTYTNAVKTGEMCNIWGQSVGPLINCVLQ